MQAAYEAFVGALLDLTDDRRDGEVVPVPGRLDGDDPYLVVAADRGTARFSDVANRLAEDRGFWLGDAFASGGSNGFDHKALGVTARGAWTAVTHHFAELGIDVQTDRISVVGIGDLSGDVFGSGMLRSDAIALRGRVRPPRHLRRPRPGPDRLVRRTDAASPRCPARRGRTTTATCSAGAVASSPGARRRSS